MLHSWATGTEDGTEDPRFGKVGNQRIEDTGPLTIKRMETVDEEFADAAIKFMDKAQDDDKPFFVWYCPSRMHVYTHTPQKYLDSIRQYSAALDTYGAGMLQLDEIIGNLLNYLDKNGLTENTIVVFATDNGPELNMFPDGGMPPFHGEKMTTYEGGLRVPCMIRWPGQIPAGKYLNGLQTNEDIFTSLAAAAGVDNLHEKLSQERKVYIDGMNNLDYWTGKSNKSSRSNYIYYYESTPMVIRVDNWKIHFATKETYWGPITQATFPIVYNIRKDPYERYSGYETYGHMEMHYNWLFAKVRNIMGAHIKSLMEYPPSQKGGSFDITETVDKIMGQ